MPPSKGPILREYTSDHREPKFSVPLYLRAMLSENLGKRGAPFENPFSKGAHHHFPKTSDLKSPLEPQSSFRYRLGSWFLWPLLTLCPYIHPIIPKPQGPYLWSFGKWWGAPFENVRMGAKNPSEITLSTPTGTRYIQITFREMLIQCRPFPWFKRGPFSANIHPIIPKLSVPIPEGMCFRKKLTWGPPSGGPLPKAHFAVIRCISAENGHVRWGSTFEKSYR